MTSVEACWKTCGFSTKGGADSRLHEVTDLRNDVAHGNLLVGNTNSNEFLNSGRLKNRDPRRMKPHSVRHQSTRALSSSQHSIGFGLKEAVNGSWAAIPSFCKNWSLFG